VDRRDLIAFEKRIADRFDAGELPYLVHLSGGNEDELLDIFTDIKPTDYVFSTHRNHYHALLKGISPKELETFIENGKSMFVFDRKLNFYSSSIVAATPAIAAGVALALKRKGSRARVWCFVGDGAEDQGHFYEAVRYVDGWNLPCTFVVEDNDRSVNATIQERWGVVGGFGDWPPCVYEYCYKATRPHSGSGNNKWLEFKKEAAIQHKPYAADSELSDIQGQGGYLEAIRKENERLARDTDTVFIGYNVRHGSAYGTLKNVPDDQKIETPLAENLMVGLAMGMSLEGFRPVLFFERHEFVMNAMDALVNTLDVIKIISDGQFEMPVLVRAVAGSVKPFYAGLTHTQNLTGVFRKAFSFPVYEPVTSGQVCEAYRMAEGRPVMICEQKGLF
jgi:pyruvate dehydrogenase E1 component alpha subunit